MQMVSSNISVIHPKVLKSFKEKIYLPPG